MIKSKIIEKVFCRDPWIILKMFYILNHDEGLLWGPDQKVTWNVRNVEIKVHLQSLGRKAFQEHLLSGLKQCHSSVLHLTYIKDYPDNTFLWLNLDSPNEFIKYELFFESVGSL